VPLGRLFSDVGGLLHKVCPKGIPQIGHCTANFDMGANVGASGGDIFEQKYVERAIGPELGAFSPKGRAGPRLNPQGNKGHGLNFAAIAGKFTFPLALFEKIR
jgi:hypothetical protein